MTIAAASTMLKINVMVYRVKINISSSFIFTPVTPVMSEIDLNKSRIQTLSEGTSDDEELLSFGHFETICQDKKAPTI
jgi:hypothetical protein